MWRNSKQYMAHFAWMHRLRGDELMPTWRLDDGRVIELLKPTDLKHLEGAVLLNISGEEVVVGQDDIDLDTRGGYLAYGLEL